jgi:single-strand DNA-binding protein
MNKYIAIGNLGKDPAVRTTQAGKMVTSFSIGVADGFGEHKTTLWMDVVCWEKLAETAGNFLHKGSKVLVEGKLQRREFEGKDGQKRQVVEVVASNLELLTPKSTTSDAPRPESPANSFGTDVDPDSEIPF